MDPKEYYLYHPTHLSSALVFTSPHSGADYSDDFLASTQLDALQIRSSEDAFVDELFSAAPKFGAPLLAASAPRAFIDLNRSTEELDPSVIADVTTNSNSPRISSGLGVIPRVVAAGRPIQSGKLTLPQAQDRLKRYYRPFHDRLTELLGASKSSFGEVLLIDCHSTPREALSSIVPASGSLPEIILGDRFGSSCASDIIDRVESAFAQAGFHVARNTPFAGAFITQRYGRPANRQNVIQVEIDRSLYMNEETICKNRDFDDVKTRLTQVISEICTLGSSGSRLAAE